MDHLVNIIWDNEALVWVAVCDSVPLALENASLDELIKRVEAVAVEILTENKPMCAGKLHFRAERYLEIASGMRQSGINYRY